MAMTTAQVTAALRHVLQENRALNGALLISSDVTDDGASVITFKTLSPAGTPLTTVKETVKTVTLTVAVT